MTPGEIAEPVPGYNLQPLPTAFDRLAEANINLRSAERALAVERNRVERGVIEEAGGIKNLGPNIVDQQRAFQPAYEADEACRAIEEGVEIAWAVVERAKAAVREYECSLGRDPFPSIRR